MAPELVPAPLAGLEIRFSREQQRYYLANRWVIGRHVYGGAYSQSWTEADRRAWLEGLLAMCLFDVRADLYRLQPVVSDLAFRAVVASLGSLLHKTTITVMLAELEAQVALWCQLEYADLKLADLSVFSPWHGVDKGRGA
ncbi:MAG: hypothetical protein KIT46_04605 [Anaerolineales bacterium]|nr:hypothetical protein [Anaerolineales bacterium]MCW5855311.1 hypothetical protein [Anaerolineales bacterium]